MPEHTARNTPAPTDTSTRNAGIVVITATLLEIAGMAHHPTVTTPDIAQAVAQITRLSGLSAWVHGGLIGLMLAILYAYTEFSRRRGLARPLIRAGLVAYTTGIFAMIIAATMSGFVVGQLASLTPHATVEDLQINAQLLILCHVLNQSFASLATILMSAGILFWSLDLLRDSTPARLAGICGCAIGLLPALALLTGSLHLDVHGMTLVVVVQSLWNIAVGVLLIRKLV
ncbi:MAG: hypothetical protein JWR07_2269 [Nevskia sp.]|nr:hypothetical protein [Nevskia sp.]